MGQMFTASDIWPQLSGSDHCPAWADVSCSGFTLPTPAQPPAFSTRNIFTGAATSAPTVHLAQQKLMSDSLSARTA